MIHEREVESTMVDKVSPEVRSAMMSAVKGKNTFPEWVVRSRVFAEGFRYRLHVKRLPGSPDMVLPRYRTAVFVHGCFWHGHECPRGKRPETNRAFWNRKIDRNIERDREAVTALESVGWTVHTLWTCKLEEGLTRLLKALKKQRRALNRRRISNWPDVSHRTRQAWAEQRFRSSARSVQFGRQDKRRSPP